MTVVEIHPQNIYYRITSLILEVNSLVTGSVVYYSFPMGFLWADLQSPRKYTLGKDREDKTVTLILGVNPNITF